MSWSLPGHVTTGALITATFINTLLDDFAVAKTSIADDGRLNGELQRFWQDIGTITPASTITLDVSLRNTFKITLSATAVTTISVTNWTASKTTPVVLRITQDGTGGRTCTLPSSWKWDGGVTPTVTTTANKTTIVVFYSDDGGTTVFASLFVANA